MGTFVENGLIARVEKSAVGLPWFALKVWLRSELKAAAALRSKGYQPFSPTYRERRRYSDRSKLVEFPMFPGYIFCAFDPGDKVQILGSLAVEYILGSRHGPVPIPESEIDAIRRSTKAEARPVEFLKDGESVKIISGPLAGIGGILSQIGRDSRLVISVHLLQRAVAVQIDADQLERIP